MRTLQLSFASRAVLLLVASLLSASAVDSAHVKKLFKNPPREYSTGPLWVWNDMLTDEQIRSTLRDLAGQKVKQVWVHPRPGLMTPYLSDQWFHLWKVALDEAKQLDMNVWIYDENSYPSGFAGGWVPELMPESRGRGLIFREEKTAPKWADNFISVYHLDGDKFESVTLKVKAGEALPDARYLVASEQRAGNSPWHGDRCYVNLLSPGVTEKFLDITLEAYRREIGGEFGKRVPGVFTDEPNIRPAGGLPWSEILAQEFQKRWGYNLLDHLPSLTGEVGDWRKIRHNYFEVLNEQFIEHWAKPYHDYCEKHGLDWTGHYWDHEWPNCVGVPDNMAMYAWHQRPAIDCLMNQYREDTHAQFGNLRMGRELSSIANQLGMKRTLCETYGAGGWDLRFEDMKRIGDWLSVLGVNTINQHLDYVTIRGARKRDHPQSFSYHEPWWDAYHVSAEYLARLSCALSQGEQINRILVLEPTTTAWMYQGNDAKLKEIGDSFFKLLMSLEAAQIEYDIGCEDVIARHGSVKDKQFCVGKRSYDVVVLPPLTENINARVTDLGEQFLQAGGTIVCLGDAPSRMDGGESSRVGEGVNEPGWVSSKVDDAATVLGRWNRHDEFRIKRAASDGGILFHMRRQLADGQLVFLVNTSIESASAGEIVSTLKGIEQWDAYTGKTQPHPFSATASGVSASFRLPPSGSLMLFFSDKPSKPAPAVSEVAKVLQPDGPPVIHRVEPNVLTLDYVDITIGGEAKRNVYFYEAQQFAFQKNGMERNPWDSAVQFKDEIISKKFAPDSGFTASYKFTIESVVPKNLAIVVERPDLYTITCNGQPVKAKVGDWWLDKAFGKIAIASAARTGENVVTIKAQPFTVWHELEPAYVLGDFTLKATEHGFVIAPDKPLDLSKWNDQGHPFYSAGVAYQQKFKVGKTGGRCVVALPKWLGSVAKVSVNGKPAGYIDAPPWECDVTKQIKRGENTVEVTVIGTLKNTLGPHHGKPALGAAWPSAFRVGPSPGPPPGEAYSTVGYGLFEPFVLKQSMSAEPTIQTSRR
jgi:hypothetical protein